MKKFLLALLVILFIALAGVGVLFFFSSRNSVAKPGTTTSSGGTFPVSSGNSTTATNPNENLMKVSTQSGGTISTLDFLHNGVTIEDPANAGTYYLAGSSGACTRAGTCPKAGTTTNFTILYYPSQGSFNIGLATEPLGQVRLEAERYLMNELGISEQEMCALKYNIGTTAYVNGQYGGENLGFSFCPGAVQLPQ